MPHLSNAMALPRQVGSDVSKVDVHLSVVKNPRVSQNHKSEVTVFAKNHVIRATESR